MLLRFFLTVLCLFIQVDVAMGATPEDQLIQALNGLPKEMNFNATALTAKEKKDFTGLLAALQAGKCQAIELLKKQPEIQSSPFCGKALDGLAVYASVATKQSTWPSFVVQDQYGNAAQSIVMLEEMLLIPESAAKQQARMAQFTFLYFMRVYQESERRGDQHASGARLSLFWVRLMLASQRHAPLTLSAMSVYMDDRLIQHDEEGGALTRSDALDFALKKMNQNIADVKPQQHREFWLYFMLKVALGGKGKRSPVTEKNWKGMAEREAYARILEPNEAKWPQDDWMMGKLFEMPSSERWEDVSTEKREEYGRIAASLDRALLRDPQLDPFKKFVFANLLVGGVLEGDGSRGVQKMMAAQGISGAFSSYEQAAWLLNHLIAANEWAVECHEELAFLHFVAPVKKMPGQHVDLSNSLQRAADHARKAVQGGDLTEKGKCYLGSLFLTGLVQPLSTERQAGESTEKTAFRYLKGSNALGKTMAIDGLLRRVIFSEDQSVKAGLRAEILKDFEALMESLSSGDLSQEEIWKYKYRAYSRFGSSYDSRAKLAADMLTAIYKRNKNGAAEVEWGRHARLLVDPEVRMREEASAREAAAKKVAEDAEKQEKAAALSAADEARDAEERRAYQANIRRLRADQEAQQEAVLEKLEGELKTPVASHFSYPGLAHVLYVKSAGADLKKLSDEIEKSLEEKMVELRKSFDPKRFPSYSGIPDIDTPQWGKAKFTHMKLNGGERVFGYLTEGNRYFIVMQFGGHEYVYQDRQVDCGNLIQLDFKNLADDEASVAAAHRP